MMSVSEPKFPAPSSATPTIVICWPAIALVSETGTSFVNSGTAGVHSVSNEAVMLPPVATPTKTSRSDRLSLAETVTMNWVLTSMLSGLSPGVESVMNGLEASRPPSVVRRVSQPAIAIMESAPTTARERYFFMGGSVGLAAGRSAGRRNSRHATDRRSLIDDVRRHEDQQVALVFLGPGLAEEPPDEREIHEDRDTRLRNRDLRDGESTDH